MWRCWLSATASRAKIMKIRMARFKIDGRPRQPKPEILSHWYSPVNLVWRASTKLSWKHKVAPELIPSWFHRNPWFPDVLSFSCEYEEVELVRICSRNQHGTQQIQKEMSNEKLSSYTLFCKVLFSSFLACHVHPFPVQQSSFLCFQPFPLDKNTSYHSAWWAMTLST